MKKKLLEVAHDVARDLHKAGGMDIKTLREFDALCLPPVKKYSRMKIKRLPLPDSSISQKK